MSTGVSMQEVKGSAALIGIGGFFVVAQWIADFLISLWDDLYFAYGTLGYFLFLFSFLSPFIIFSVKNSYENIRNQRILDSSIFITLIGCAIYYINHWNEITNALDVLTSPDTLDPIRFGVLLFILLIISPILGGIALLFSMAWIFYAVLSLLFSTVRSIIEIAVVICNILVAFLQMVYDLYEWFSALFYRAPKLKDQSYRRHRPQFEWEFNTAGNRSSSGSSSRSSSDFDPSRFGAKSPPRGWENRHPDDATCLSLIHI